MVELGILEKGDFPMTTTTINYRELCAYVAANEHRLPPIVNSILISWGELEAPSADTLEQRALKLPMY